MRYEDVIAEVYDGKSLPIDPGILDEDFDVCIKARQAMTQPCYWIQGKFSKGTPQSYWGACWAGHIFKALSYDVCARGFPTPDQAEKLEQIARKLGFKTYPFGASAREQLYTYNDLHSHSEVLNEFDRRLQLWT